MSWAEIALFSPTTMFRSIVVAFVGPGAIYARAGTLAAIAEALTANARSAA